MADDRLKIAVFIDFDNIEIGVKNSLGGQFDVGAVLEAVKERGEVVSKVAYGDWTHATDYGRSMSQHAIHMVQRNLTPGGDKNGADINLALDALEMAFTHSHINAFVVVGGDSDFITLVEKLKQYDRKVFVVGGRSFTSQVMQKNCTEFMAYEDIVGMTSRGRQAGGRTRAVTDIAAAMPLIRRAIKLLADREMTPHLGLLKSTLLQLDSSFSEKAYGAGSFRDFIEKLAKAGSVALKGADRSVSVELREAGEPAAADHPISAPAGQEPTAGEPGTRLAHADGYRIMAQAFSRSGANPRFPMYVRQVKQFVKTFDESFDERRYGFVGMLDALRFGQREGLFRLDRDRQGGIRVHPGAHFTKLTTAPEAASAVAALSTDEIPQDHGALLNGESTAPQEAPLAEDHPAQVPQPSPAETDASAAAHAAEETWTTPSGETPALTEAEAPAEAVAAPRARSRKRTAVPPPRAKKKAAATGSAKRAATRARARKV